MKLRRALVTVASTAALLPAALAAAPAAFADDGSTTPTMSSTATDTATAAPTGTATAPAPSDTATGTTGSGDGTTGTPSAGASGGSDSSSTSTPAPGDTSTAAPAPSASASSDPTDEPTAYCSDETPGYQAELKISVAGLPGRIARGSGWHSFTITVDNPTRKAVTGVDLVADVFNPYSAAPDAFKQLKLQAYDPDTHQWFDPTDGAGGAAYLGAGDMPAHTSANVGLRLNVEAGAPLGETIALGYGAYPDRANDCIAEASGTEEFKVVSAADGTGGTATHRPGGKIPTGARKAAAHSASSNATHAIPAKTTQAALTGSLAHTGSPSQLPLIGGIGAAAVVAGAGTLFAVRRRRAGSSV
jgi:LPXTG-motif cell wall-anchored protein